eukprot:1056825-Rhodomonas_salina.1
MHTAVQVGTPTAVAKPEPKKELVSDLGHNLFDLGVVWTNDPVHSSVFCAKTLFFFLFLNKFSDVPGKLRKFVLHVFMKCRYAPLLHAGSATSVPSGPPSSAASLQPPACHPPYLPSRTLRVLLPLHAARVPGYLVPFHRFRSDTAACTLTRLSQRHASRPGSRTIRGQEYPGSSSTSSSTRADHRMSRAQSRSRAPAALLSVHGWA